MNRFMQINNRDKINNTVESVETKGLEIYFFHTSTYEKL
jgi:hypothetical protein